MLQISVKTVEAQISKALRILRLELKDYLKMLDLFIPPVNLLISFAPIKSFPSCFAFGVESFSCEFDSDKFITV